MQHIFLEEFVYGGQGVCVGGSIKIEGSPQKMAGRVCGKELFGAGCVTAYFVEQAAYAIGGVDVFFIYIIRLVGVLIGHFKSVVHQLFQGIVMLTYFLIAHVDLSVKGREFYIDPVRVFGCFAKEAAILGNVGIHRVFEGVRISGLIKNAVFFYREADVEKPGYSKV